jgi:hypothetical protein
MKKIISFIVLSVLSLSLVIGLITVQGATAQDDGSSGFQCPEETGLFAAETCGLSYYSCDFGVPTIQYCGEETVFNQVTPNSGFCDYPFVMAQCYDQDFVCPMDNGLFSAGVCQNNFYNCTEGTAYEVYCPGTTIFEESALGEGKCNYPELIPACNDIP